MHRHRHGPRPHITMEGEQISCRIIEQDSLLLVKESRRFHVWAPRYL